MGGKKSDSMFFIKIYFTLAMNSDLLCYVEQTEEFE